MKRLLIPVAVAFLAYVSAAVPQPPGQKQEQVTPYTVKFTDDAKPLPKGPEVAQADKPKEPEKPKLDPKHGRGYIQPAKNVLESRHRVSKSRYAAVYKAIPVVTDRLYDARIKGVIPPTGDQDGCGSCYDWSGCKVCASAQMAAGVVKADGKFMIAPSYFLDCQNVGGCNGGDEYEVATIIHTSGAPSQDQYGGDGASPGRCKPITGMTLYTVSSLIMVSQSDGVAPTQDIKNFIAYYGYVSVAGAAGSDWDNVTENGTITGRSNGINHAIGLVGWDDDHDNGDGSKGAWILSNQWGTGWGGSCKNKLNPTPVEGGYAWIKYGADSIGTEAFVAVAGSGPIPPPPPPPPPGPGPGPPPTPGTSAMTLSTALPAGTYYLSTIPITKDTTIGDIVGQLTPPTPTPEKWDWPEQMKFNQAILKALQDIQTELKKKP